MREFAFRLGDRGANGRMIGDCFIGPRTLSRPAEHGEI